MARPLNNVPDRIATIRSAWKEPAPQVSFAGKTLAEFDLAMRAPLQVRQEIESLEKQLEGRKADRMTLDEAASVGLDLVVNSVKGTPGFGPDSPLYRAMGYIRKSERKTGLTRKGFLQRKAPVSVA
jgi:hypothetical protein